MEIRIRKYKDTDIPLFYEAVKESLTELSVWFPWAHEHYSQQDSEKWIKELIPNIWKEQKGCEFIILNPEEDQVLGGCALEQLDLKNKVANIAYWVRTSATGLGIATQASFFLLEYGFEEIGLEQIRIIPSAENPASKKVAQKLPYEHMYLVPNGFQIRDQISDAEVYSVIKESYRKTKS